MTDQAEGGVGLAVPATDWTGKVSGVRRVGRNVSVLAGSQVVTWSMALLWTVALPRALGPYAMGQLVTAWAASCMLIVLLAGGTRGYVVRELTLRPDRAPGLVGSLILVRLGLTVPALAVLTLYIRFARFSSQESLVIYLTTAGIVLALLAEPIQAGFQAIERMEFMAYNEVVRKVAETPGVIVVALVGLGAVGVTSWTLAVAVALVGLNLWWMRRFFQLDLRPNRKRLKALASGSLSYWAFGIFFQIYLWIDAVLLALMAPPVVVGWYGLPTKLVQTLMFVATIVSAAWLPRMVAAQQAGGEQLRNTARLPIELVLILGLPLSAGTALVAGPLLNVFYGPAYAPATTVLAILGLSIVPTYFNIMVNQVLIAKNRQVLWALVMVGASVVNPVLNVLLIRYTQNHLANGAIGAAASFLLTELLIVVVGVVMVRDILDLHTIRRLVRALLATVGMAGVVIGVGRFGLAAQVLLGGASFGVLVFALRVPSTEELEWLGGRLARTGRFNAPLRLASKVLLALATR